MRGGSSGIAREPKEIVLGVPMAGAPVLIPRGWWTYVVVAVTAPWRHQCEVPVTALTELSNRQIEVEAELEKLEIA